MSETLTKIAGTTVGFGDVVQLSKERSKDPESDGFERYIGLEHLEPSDLKVRSWGDLADGVTFTNVFRPGQVLFGKRRAYQRKVAVADFSGVCSGDIYVLEPKGEQLLPELLPFICQSEPFYDYVISMSQGGLSPRVNWKALAKYEFALPPLEEQRRIAEVLQAVNRQTESLRIAEAKISQLLSATLQAIFAGRGDSKPLAEWCRNLITYGIVQAGPDTPGGIPYIRVSDMTSGKVLQLEGMLRTTEAISAKYKRSEISAGDIVVALRGPVGLPMVAPPELDGANLTQGTARVSVDSDNCRDYVLWALRSPATKRQYMRYAKGSTFSEISLAALRQIKVPVKDPKEQQDIAGRLNALADHQIAIAQRLQGSALLAKAILNEVMGEVQ